MSLSTNKYLFSDYLKKDRDIDREKHDKISSDIKPFRIAILTSFTSKGIKEVLNVKCHENGISSEFYVAPYNQYAQELLRQDSKLYAFNPDLTLLFIDIRALLGELFFAPYCMSDNERKDWMETIFQEIKGYVNRLLEKTEGTVIFHTFEVPSYSPFGILENKQQVGLCEMVRSLNHAIEECYRKSSRVYVFDYDRFCSFYGKRNIFNYKMYYLGDIKIDFPLIPPLCNAYMSYIKPLNNIIKKCLVLDLDNTLWGGIVGEDGFDGIKLGPTPEGRPFWEFQKHILQLFEKGVVLAVNSRNNEEDVFRVLNEHPYCVLRENHFAALRINWQDKVANMREIAQEINIGLDSLVFMDDDKMNCELVRHLLPEVTVVDLPDDPTQYVQTLFCLDEFNTLQITDEDKSKGMMYAQQRSRRKLQQSSSDILDYLRSLQMVVTIKQDDLSSIPRIAQLTQKTNQFNMTTRRYSEKEAEDFATGQRHMVVSAMVEDKFGDNGLTGLAIVEKGTEQWRVDTFLISCRVIGRGVEDAIMAYLVDAAKKGKARSLLGEFISTKKNAPAKGFFEEKGFRLLKDENGEQVWEFDLNNIYQLPVYLKVVRG